MLLRLLEHLSNFQKVHYENFQSQYVPDKHLALELHFRLHKLFFSGIQRADTRSNWVPHDGHLEQDLRGVAFSSTSQLLVF